MIAAAADARRTLHPEALIILVMRRGEETSLSYALHFLSSEGRKEAVCTDTINFALFKLCQRLFLFFNFSSSRLFD